MDSKIYVSGRDITRGRFPNLSFTSRAYQTMSGGKCLSRFRCSAPYVVVSSRRRSRSLMSLQKEEKFFSRSVTHVVTTRPIPPEHATNSPGDGYSQVKTENGSRTIDPSLLGRPQDLQANAAQRRTTDLLDATLQARSQHAAFHK